MAQNHRIAVWVSALVGMTAAGGCASSPSLYRAAEAYRTMHIASDPIAQPEYHIGPLDVLKVSVLYEPDLSNSAVRVDASGNVSIPLVGDLKAADKTSLQLSDEIARRLGTQYLRDPHVSVTIETSNRQKVTVEGDVNAPGVYEISGSASLLEALARAQSPNRVASLKEVAVFRMIDGHRVGAVFDVNRIRAGRDSDPLILGGDIVVVGLSHAQAAYRDLLQFGPGFAPFVRP